MDTTILGLDDERAKEMPYIASMGIYVFSKDAMLKLLRDTFPGANDFGSEVIPGATSVGMRVSRCLKFCILLNVYILICTILTVGRTALKGCFSFDQKTSIRSRFRFRHTYTMVTGKILGQLRHSTMLI